MVKTKKIKQQTITAIFFAIASFVIFNHSANGHFHKDIFGNLQYHSHPKGLGANEDNEHSHSQFEFIYLNINAHLFISAVQIPEIQPLPVQFLQYCILQNKSISVTLKKVKNKAPPTQL